MFVPVIVINDNPELLSLTTDSIEKSCIGWNYVVLNTKNKQKFPVIFEHAKQTDEKIFLVVSAGVVLNLKENSLPPLKLLKKNHMIVSRKGLFFNNLYGSLYEKEKTGINQNIIDTSVFIINTEKFDFIPESDSGFLSKITIKDLPLYMNHKGDPLIKEVLSVRHLFKHGITGENAHIFNYVDYILKGECTVSESYALCFEKLLPYIDNLADRYKNNIRKITRNIKQSRIDTFRKKYYEIYKLTK